MTTTKPLPTTTEVSPAEIAQVEETLRELNTPPMTDVIEIEISKRARHTAKDFTDNEHCIICTQLRLDGYTVDGINPSYARLVFDGAIVHYIFDESQGFSEYLCMINGAQLRPYYSKEVVGRKITMRRIK